MNSIYLINPRHVNLNHCPGLLMDALNKRQCKNTLAKRLDCFTISTVLLLQREITARKNIDRIIVFLFATQPE